MMKSNRFIQFCVVSAVVTGLAGCESRVDNVNAQMAEIRNQPPLKIEPAPVFPPVPSYSYDAYRIKSPFVPTSIANELKLMAGKRVYPNLNRIKQPLEQYDLEQLFMKGTMHNGANQTVALIQTPDQHVEQVQVGSYMGKNSGRIVAIQANQISLIEIVPDGQDGYVQRPRTLILRSDTL